MFIYVWIYVVGYVCWCVVWVGDVGVLDDKGDVDSVGILLYIWVMGVLFVLVM